MDEDRPDLERFIDVESQKALADRAWFIKWPVWLRLIVACMFATAVLAPSLAFVGFLHKHSDEAMPEALVIAACVLPALMCYGAAVFYALSPARATRHGLRTLGSYPTNSPGYGIWQGDRGKPKSSEDTQTPGSNRG